MSHLVNDRIVDEIKDLEEVVRWHQDYWTGTIWDKMLEHALVVAKETLDPTRINELLLESSREMYDLEYRPDPTPNVMEFNGTTINFDEVIV
jgi:hypothetical protein